MFQNIQRKTQDRFKELLAAGQLFQVDVDRDEIWQTYINAFPEEFKAGNICSCCKSFIRQNAGVVAIKNNERLTLWDFEPEDPEYNDAIKALRRYVATRPIKGLFFAEQEKCGVKQNFDPKNNVFWNHYYLEVPRQFVNRDPGTQQSTALGNKDVLLRSLKEITDDAVETVLELMAQGSLYRGSEYKKMLTDFQVIQKNFKKVKGDLQDNFAWANATVNSPVVRIRNTAIGALLTDLSEGRDLDSAVSAFERMVAPANYKRPTSLITPRMVQDAQDKLKEMGLVEALNRRLLSENDLNVNNSLFVYRQPTTDDIFEQLKESKLTNPKNLTKVEEVSIDDFISKVLPTVKSVKVLVENHHFANFVSLLGPDEQTDKTLFKWDNNYSWSYTGQVADSIKERVKQAGGKVDGVLRISLSWHNYDDLDLHVIEPSGYRIYFGNKGAKSRGGGTLDVDMNAGGGTSRNAVENIYWTKKPTEFGTYKVIVNNYYRRENIDEGFEVEMEYEGEVFSFSSDKNGSSGKNFDVFSFDFSKDGVTVKGKSSQYTSNKKWNINSGYFHKVKAITYSPNYWQNNVGNKHIFFFLEGCVSDEDPRPFYNEFLKEEFSANRKVFEVLGGKIKVKKTEKELSGLGFSETIRNHVFLEVEGNFKRIIKIKF